MLLQWNLIVSLIRTGSIRGANANPAFENKNVRAGQSLPVILYINLYEWQVHRQEPNFLLNSFVS